MKIIILKEIIYIMYRIISSKKLIQLRIQNILYILLYFISSFNSYFFLLFLLDYFYNYYFHRIWNKKIMILVTIPIKITFLYTYLNTRSKIAIWNMVKIIILYISNTFELNKIKRYKIYSSLIFLSYFTFQSFLNFFLTFYL